MDEDQLDLLEQKYKSAIVKVKEMMEQSQTPGAYHGYKSQGELIGVFLFDINSIRKHPKDLKDVLPK